MIWKTKVVLIGIVKVFVVSLVGISIFYDDSGYKEQVLQN